MELNFIGQGLDSNSNVTTGNLIIESLVDEQFTSFNAFVAFVSIGGINNVIDQLTAFMAKGSSVRLYIGVDLHGTSREALEKLLELGIETYIVFSPNNIIYHPKIYTFEGEAYSRVIIGSSNLTVSGLFQNIESSVSVKINNENDEMGGQFISDIYEHYNAIIRNDHPSCQLLTNELLNILVNSKIVLPKQVNRNKLNKINKEYETKDLEAYDALLKSFGKLKSKRPPKGFDNGTVKDEINVKDNEEIDIVSETIELSTGSMWVETGRMTGGSKNQLDVSKKGISDGGEIDGSVSYFGIDPDNTGLAININLHLGDKIYKGNTIKYTPANSNWRIQLKGETDNGEKLTTISRIQLGQDGGFVDKILLFTRIDQSNYKLEILDANDRDKLIDNSS